MKSKLNRH